VYPANRNTHRSKENVATGEKSCSRKLQEQGQQIGNSGGAVGLISVGFWQDGSLVAIPKGDFRAAIMGSERWEPLPRSIQVLETL
jgi:hypothetical protein